MLLKENNIIVLTGATASGKSQLAIDLISEYITNGVIINADAQQVYKEIPIITAQPKNSDFIAAPHLLYGHKNVTQDYSVGIWLKEVVAKINQLIETKQVPILVGGSGMYLNSLLQGIANIPDIDQQTKDEAYIYINQKGLKETHRLLSMIDPISLQKITATDTQRITRNYEVYLQTGKPLSYFQQLEKIKYFAPEQFVNFELRLNREELYHKINHRFVEMMKDGVIEETEVLMRNFGELLPKSINRRGIGIGEINLYLLNQLSKEEMVDKVTQLMRNYAKRQVTWFKNQFDYFHKVGTLKDLAAKLS
ncbi:tRNA (adenosine(37)-N6)-dimethylallyltransferase MiaA [Rickettsiales endosymbiont of Stachyamoeba lipophora]|uniref:tRNA (adenosine(37)-N6)-dimethylallyltransferase MiaA n=1 Tax=Rickettsiales endosymbiont of Stachyamoeba lipophora TaxID=2486578 RepID=UPI000F650CA4|nr:tRNA (adenosine(37)-N6)-dimethylallyltransferase MiaA [Rickettsiales endosymbiont of Stachyamoeba lipophora]AZL14984.1 tRNA (adenosine(37)-N6)-dimethylallyltransferase MiaA [Rickettsiales endosymbiont of Stachyamoeba lipophora]